MLKKLEINSKIENICSIEKLIDEFSEELKISSDLYGKILIACIEGVNNSIVHGNKLDENKTVKFELRKTETNIVIRIADQGVGFDYNNVPDPTKPENIENISGRGVFLMKKLADQINFYEKGTTIELIFNLEK